MAEPNNQEPQTTQNPPTGTQNSNDELFAKIDSALEKRIEGLTKSILKDNGFEDADVKELAKKYRDGRNSKQEQLNENLTTLQSENAQLKAQILQSKIDKVTTASALKMGVDSSKIAYLTRLADFSNVTDDKGNIDEKAVDSAISKVLEDLPEFKLSKNTNGGFVPVGGKEGDKTAEEDADKALRKAFGLK